MDTLYKALSDPQRRKILSLLKKRDFSVSELLEHFDISMPSLSHHLDILKRCELVIAQRKGRQMIYSLNTSVFEEMIQSLMQFFS